MKKKKHHRSSKHRHATRNAATGVAPSVERPRPRPRRTLHRAPAPSWKSIVAAVAGGAGSAALGGLVVNQKILSPEAVGIGLMLGGGATAYFSEGMPRIVGSSIAASGAGQFALAWMTKHATKAQNDDKSGGNNANGSAAPAAPTTPAQLPPPPSVRRSPDGGGIVTDLFRNAADDLEMMEDEWRYGIRDDAYANVEPVVIDLDEAA